MGDGINLNHAVPRLPTQPIESSGSAQSEAKPVLAESAVKQVDAAPEAAATLSSKEQARVSAEQLQTAVDQLNRFMHEGQRALSFSVDESGGEVVVRVSDRETNQLVRQIPTEEALAIREHLDQVMGMLFSEKV